jgi:hypothetical protein
LALGAFLLETSNLGLGAFLLETSNLGLSYLKLPTWCLGLLNLVLFKFKNSLPETRKRFKQNYLSREGWKLAP